MARFRRKARRASNRRGSFSFFKRRRGHSSNAMGNPLKVVIPAMVYGAGRNWLVSAASPITSKMGFLGAYADEALFGVAGYYMAKKGHGMIRDIGRSMLIVEAASVGNQLAGTFTGGSMSSSNAYVYG